MIESGGQGNSILVLGQESKKRTMGHRWVRDPSLHSRREPIFNKIRENIAPDSQSCVSQFILLTTSRLIYIKIRFNSDV